MMKLNKKKSIALILIIIFTTLCIQEAKSETTSNRVYLTMIVHGGGVRPNYGAFIIEYLRPFGIIVTQKIVEWTVYVEIILITHAFDLMLTGFSGSNDPDMSVFFSENGTLNFVGVNTKIPYGVSNEYLLNQISEIMDFEARQQICYEWQELLMDKIVPMLPLFSTYHYEATWSNLKGYDIKWGLTDSLPYMSFEGLHTNQSSVEELVITDAKWEYYNPYEERYSSSYSVFSLISEQILNLKSSLEPLKTGLIIDWAQSTTNPNLFKFTMRDDVYWNPSYNITDRDEYSSELDINTTPLMIGLQDEISNGTNQQVIAKDVIFTLLSLANPLVSDWSNSYSWLNNAWIDTEDNLVFFIEIDGDPETEDEEAYPSFWLSLTEHILPEFFLNSTSSVSSLSSGGIEMKGLYEGIDNSTAWQTYYKSSFGCGKYLLDYHNTSSITVLQRSPWWMNIGAKNGETQTLDLETIKIIVEPDVSAVFDGFKEGYYDIIDFLNIFPEERRDMEQDSQFNVYSRFINSISFLAFNLRRTFIGGDSNFIYLDEEGKEEYTKGTAVRKAICYAIDREELNQEIHNGDYFVTHSVIPSFLEYWYNDEIVKYDYNLNKTTEWLTAAGFIDVPTTTSTLSLIFCAIILIVLSSNHKLKNLFYSKKRRNQQDRL